MIFLTLDLNFFLLHAFHFRDETLGGIFKNTLTRARARVCVGFVRDGGEMACQWLKEAVSYITFERLNKKRNYGIVCFSSEKSVG